MRYRIGRIPHNLVFFALAAMYLWLVVEPRLIYQGFGFLLPDAPTFMTGGVFLREALSRPGGLALYAAGFLSQGFYYSWLGAAIIVLSALFLSELCRRHFLFAGSPRVAAVLSSVPAIAVVLIYSRYKHALPACVVVSAGLLGSLVFEKLPLRRPAVRALVYVGMASVLFWWAGAGGLLVLTVMTVIHGLFVRRDWRLAALAAPASLVIVWFFARYVFLIPTRPALLALTPISAPVAGGMKTFSGVLVFVLYGFVPVGALLLFLGQAVLSGRESARKKRSKPGGKKEHESAAKKKLPLPLLGQAALIVLPIAATAVGLGFSYDPMAKAFVVAHDYSLRRQWDEILAFARRLPKGTSNPYFNHDIIRALYHTGRLSSDMFDFPMLPHGLFLTHEQKVSYLTQLKLCDTFLEMGQVNAAEKLASEILAGKRHSPLAVEKLAWINIIKGQTETARIYLNALKKDLVHRGTAQTLLDGMDSGFAPEQAAYIDGIRSRMFADEYPGTGNDPIEKVLTGLLDRNPHNKMAFEYLMACYLLSGRVDKVAAHVQRLNELGYETVPTLYEEAILIYVNSKEARSDPSKFQVQRTTMERYRKFIQLRNSMRPQNRQQVLRQLIVEFGNSYFFYFTFGCVGVV